MEISQRKPHADADTETKRQRDKKTQLSGSWSRQAEVGAGQPEETQARAGRFWCLLKAPECSGYLGENRLKTGSLNTSGHRHRFSDVLCGIGTRLCLVILTSYSLLSLFIFLIKF